MSTALTNLLTAVSHMFDVPTTPDVNIAELDLKEVVKQYGSLDLTSLVPSWKDLLQETLLAASTAGKTCDDSCNILYLDACMELLGQIPKILNFGKPSKVFQV